MGDDSSLQSFGKFIQGTCTLMCPLKEMIHREKEGLLHPLEVKTEGKPQEKRADPNKTVKCFSRSAAGQKTPSPSDLRPAPVLQITVSYLIRDVASVNTEDARWVDRYEYVTDRLRSVRQDMIIQALKPHDCIKLLEPMAFFHAYSGYRLCHLPMKLFDPKINFTHLQECLKRLLVLYDALYKIEDKPGHNDPQNICRQNTHLIEALFVILHIGEPEALNRAFHRQINKCCTYKSFEKEALELSLAWAHKNYVKVFRLIQRLPPILACTVIPALPTIRRYTLMVMSQAYNSKVLTFPLTKLQEILLFDSCEEVIDHCNYYGILRSSSQNDMPAVKFQKESFKRDLKPIQPEAAAWLDKVLLEWPLTKVLEF